MSNNVTEEQTFHKPLQEMEKLSTMWLKENVGMSGCIIVANTLLTAKIAHRASVNGISKDMKTKIRRVIKDFIWGGPNKKTRVK